MLLTNARRILKSGFVSFWRNGFVSFAAILVMVVTLFVIGSLVFAQAMLGATLAQIQDKVDINVYFVTAAAEEDIIALQKKIEQLPEVSSVEYTSRDEALEEFRARHANDHLTLQALEELGDNPLGANLSIKAKETSQYEGIATFLESDTVALSSVEGKPIIDKINFFQNKVAIDRLSQIIEYSKKFGWFVSLVLAAASAIIIFSTIRLAIYTAREEIAVMRLVGASNSYIRGPFVFEGIMYGLIAGLIVLALFYPLTLSLGPKTEAFFGDANMYAYYLSHIGLLTLVILGSGIVLGAFSSYLAVKKYLKV